jgi:lysophospholipase L1-like esterase
VCFAILLLHCAAERSFSAADVVGTEDHAAALAIASRAGHPLKILPLGDSITQLGGEHLGYRFVLWKLLIDAGIPFDFIGSMRETQEERAGIETTHRGHAFDADHEGHSGWTAADLVDGCSWEPDRGALPEWLDTYTPDIVLLHIGTNDVFQSTASDATIGKIETIIDLLQESNPNVCVFLAKTIPLAGEWGKTYDSSIVELNSRIGGVAARKTTATSRVIVVDQYSGINGTVDTYDGIHPSAAGSAKMAQRWADAILYDGTPVARMDRYQAIQEFVLRVDAASSVLVNDYSAGAPILAGLIQPPTNGALTLNADGTFAYAPNAGFVGVDRFTYRAESDRASSRDCGVEITINSNAPLACADIYATAAGSRLEVDAGSGVLANDVTYTGPLRATLVNAPQSGRLELEEDGSFVYAPDPGFVGADKFVYAASDGEKTSGEATARLWSGHEGPVAWWKLDEGSGLVARDAADGHLDGTLTHMDESSWIDGALRLDGVDEFVTLPPLNLNTNLLTIAAWVKRDGPQPIFAGIVVSSDGEILAGLGMGSGPGWEANHELGYFWNGKHWEWSSGLILPDNEWCLVALVVTPTQATVYLGRNGEIAASSCMADHDPEEFDGTTRIGDNAQKDSRHFSGYVRDVRIYDRPLSVGEIQRIERER